MKTILVTFIILVALVLVLIAPARALTAEASGAVCPAPGTGLAGARNMILDPTMGQIMADHTAWQGDRGMHTAVINTRCD